MTTTPVCPNSRYGRVVKGPPAGGPLNGPSLPDDQACVAAATIRKTKTTVARTATVANNIRTLDTITVCPLSPTTETVTSYVSALDNPRP